MAYLDTGSAVAALTRKARTAAVQAWLAPQAPETPAAGEWTLAEFSAALSMKVRTRQLDAISRTHALAAFTALTRDTFSVVRVTAADFRFAAHRADRHDSGLRAGDALHLAIAAARGDELLSLHRVQVKAALALGISARLS